MELAQPFMGFAQVVKNARVWGSGMTANQWRAITLWPMGI